MRSLDTPPSPFTSRTSRAGRGRFLTTAMLPRSRSAFARAPGKVILTGEHFVVLGAPALSMAVNLYSTARATLSKDTDGIEVDATVPVSLLDGAVGSKQVEPRMLLEPLRVAAESALQRRTDKTGVRVDVQCGIPVGAGLGSSASTSVAVIAAVAMSQGVRLDNREIFRLAYRPEKLIHGKPSGVDQATTIYGGVIEYRRPGKVDRVTIKEEPEILVCDTGVHRSTGRLVGAVVRRSKAREKAYGEHVDEVRQITVAARRALEKGRALELGLLMNRNQELLDEIGVSTPSLDHLITVARRAGALGAKLTGAGGGGCMIALCADASSEDRIGRRLARAGGLVYKSRLDRKGVVIRSVRLS